MSLKSPPDLSSNKRESSLQRPKVLLVTTEVADHNRTGLGVENDRFWTELQRRDYPFASCFLSRDQGVVSLRSHFTVPVRQDLPFDMSAESRAVNSAWSTRNLLRDVFSYFQPDIISINDSAAFLPFYFMAHRVQFTMREKHVGMSTPESRTQKGMQTYWDQRLAILSSRKVVFENRRLYERTSQYIDQKIPPLCLIPGSLDFQAYAQSKIRHREGKIVVGIVSADMGKINEDNSLLNFLDDLGIEYCSKLDVRYYGADLAKESPKNSDSIGLKTENPDEKIRALAEIDILVMLGDFDDFGNLGWEALLSNCKLIASCKNDLSEDAHSVGLYRLAPTDLTRQLMDDIKGFEGIKMLQNANHYRNFALRESALSLESMVDGYVDVWQAMKT